jgi:DNA-binding response OmpR family regulator
MLILLVEDDVKIASFIIKGLRSAGYAVDHAPDGEEGLQLALSRPYDTAVIDIMLPRRDGLSLIERMRAEKVNTPVLILSAKGSVDDRVRGLQTGGDDYLTKPFAFSELLARVQALIRRAGGGRPLRQSSYPGSNPWGKEDRIAAPGVFAPRISPQKRRKDRLQDDDHGTCVGLQFRSSNQRRRGQDQQAQG